jgi:hypothetical protein
MKNNILVAGFVALSAFSMAQDIQVSVQQAFWNMKLAAQVAHSDGNEYTVNSSTQGWKVGVTQTQQQSEYGSLYYGAAVYLPTQPEERIGVVFQPHYLVEAKVGGMVKPSNDANYSFKLGYQLVGMFQKSSSQDLSSTFSSGIETGFRYDIGNGLHMDIDLSLPTSKDGVSSFGVGFAKTIDIS